MKRKENIASGLRRTLWLGSLLGGLLVFAAPQGAAQEETMGTGPWPDCGVRVEPGNITIVTWNCEERAVTTVTNGYAGVAALYNRNCDWLASNQDLPPNECPAYMPGSIQKIVFEALPA